MTTRTCPLVRLAIIGVLAVTVVGCANKSTSSVGGSVSRTPVATQAATPEVPATPASPVTASSTEASSAIDGLWNGTYSSTSSPGSDGTFEVTYVTSASGQLSGSIQIHKTPCVSTGTVNGRLHSNAITFGAVKGAQTITFTGTISGQTMSGTYDAPDCGRGKGTWRATRA